MSDNSTAVVNVGSTEVALVAISVMFVIMQWCLVEARRLWKATRGDPEPGKYLGPSSVFLVLYACATLMGIGSAFIAGYALFTPNQSSVLLYPVAFLFAAAWVVLVVAPLVVVDEARRSVFQGKAIRLAWFAHFVVVTLALAIAFAMQPILDSTKGGKASIIAPIAFIMAVVVFVAESEIMRRMLVKLKSQYAPRDRAKRQK